MRNLLAIFLGKVTFKLSQLFKLGSGGTWPGEVALTISPNILIQLFSQLNSGVIIVAGTNGKTTTSLMIQQILEKSGFTTIHNATGANLLNGITSACIKESDWLGRINADWGVFETDENSLPLILQQLNSSSSETQLLVGEARSDNKEISRRNISKHKKLIIVLLNLFRDQLDRYGEVDVIAEKWAKALNKLPSGATIILNADDPQIAHLGMNYASSQSQASREEVSFPRKRESVDIDIDPRVEPEDDNIGFQLRSDNNVLYFGINDKKHFLKQKEHATDSTFCLNCGGRLVYEGIYYSHIGIWKCVSCGEKRPQPDLSVWDSPMPGLYNQYNTLAAVSVAKALDIKDNIINQTLQRFKPAFGRQEEFVINGKKIKIFLSKNPAGFNASLRTVLELNPKTVLLVLNDRIPDGRDVSWIWDVDFETLIQDKHKIIVSGDRVYDLALRMKYAQKYQKLNIKDQKHKSNIKNSVNANLVIEPILEKAIKIGLSQSRLGEALHILATYSAMLEVRKILTGKKIL